MFVLLNGCAQYIRAEEGSEKHEIMARQEGIIKITGKVGGLSFYRTQDGFLVREKVGADSHRVKNDPAFVRTRENASEFGSCAKSGKLLRDSVRRMMKNSADWRVTPRLVKIMTQIKNLDETSVRGKRNVGVGIETEVAKAILKGFNFNNRAILGSILFNDYSVDLGTGETSLNNFVPINDLNAPAGATHVSLRGAWAKVDFAVGEAEVRETNVVNLPIDGGSSDVVLTPGVAPNGSGTSLYFLMVEFFQEVNGNRWALKSREFNALGIVEVG